MRITKYISLFTFLSLLSISAVAEQASAQSVKKLMDKTGAGNLSMQMMEQMIPALKNMLPNAPETFWEDVMKEIDADGIIGLVIPIYQKYLTEEDVTALNSFYDTPAGKKMVSVQPAIMQESMSIGQTWGQKIAQGVMQKYKEQENKEQENKEE